MAPSRPTTFFQPSLMLLKAVSFRGRTKPVWTTRSRVPPATLERVKVTMVFRGAP